MGAETSYSAYLKALPCDWKIAPISQIAKVVGGGTPSRDVATYWNGAIPWVTPGEVSREESIFLSDTRECISAAGLASSGATLLPVGTLMITTRATLGARAISATPMTTNQGFKSLVFADPSDAPFYFYVANKLKPELRRRASGTTFLEVSSSEVSDIRVPVPPKEERTQIAHILDTLDTTIRQTEAIIAKLKQVKQGLLHDLLTRGIAANGELRPPQSEAPHLYKASPLGWIPVEWDTATLGRLSTDSTIGPFGSDLVASDYRASGVPVVFVRDVKADRLEWKSNVYVSTSKASALSAHVVRSGDVVATKMGLPPCVAAVYPESMPQGIITADIVRLRFDVNEVRPAWVSLSMNEHSVIKQVEQITAGVTRSKVTLRDVRNIEIRFPPVNEQDRILDRMASLDSRLAAESAVLEKLYRQKSGLMDDLLTGRVRVTPLLQEHGQSSTEGTA